MIYLALGLIMIFLLLIFIVLILQINSKSCSASVVSKPAPPLQTTHTIQPRDYRFSDSPLDFKQGWWGADVNFPLSSTKDLPIPSYDDSGNYRSVVNPVTGQKIDIEPACAPTTNNNKNINNDHKLIPYMISYLFPQGTKDDSNNPYWSSLTIPPTSQNSTNYAPPRLITAPNNNSTNTRLPAYESNVRSYDHRIHHDASGELHDSSGNGFMDYNLDAYSPF